MPVTQTTRWSGESLELTIDGTLYNEVQEVRVESGNPRLVNARCSKDLKPVNKQIGLADDNPVEIVGLMAGTSYLALGGKIVTIILVSKNGTATIFDADVRIHRAPQIRATHESMFILNLSGNAQSIRYPDASHLQT